MANVKVYDGDPVFKHPDEQLVYYYKFTEVLPAGVQVSSAVVTEQSGDGNLTAGIGTPEVLLSEETIDGVTLPANETVKVLITGGTDQIDYETACLATLDDADTQKPMLIGPIKVRQ